MKKHSLSSLLSKVNVEVNYNVLNSSSERSVIDLKRHQKNGKHNLKHNLKHNSYLIFCLLQMKLCPINHLSDTIYCVACKPGERHTSCARTILLKVTELVTGKNCALRNCYFSAQQS